MIEFTFPYEKLKRPRYLNHDVIDNYKSQLAERAEIYLVENPGSTVLDFYNQFFTYELSVMIRTLYSTIIDEKELYTLNGTITYATNLYIIQIFIDEWERKEHIFDPRFICFDVYMKFLKDLVDIVLNTAKFVPNLYSRERYYYNNGFYFWILEKLFAILNNSNKLSLSNIHLEQIKDMKFQLEDHNKKSVGNLFSPNVCNNFMVPNPKNYDPLNFQHFDCKQICIMGDDDTLGGLNYIIRKRLYTVESLSKFISYNLFDKGPVLHWNDLKEFFPDAEEKVYYFKHEEENKYG